MEKIVDDVNRTGSVIDRYFLVCIHRTWNRKEKRRRDFGKILNAYVEY